MSRAVAVMLALVGVAAVGACDLGKKPAAYDGPVRGGTLFVNVQNGLDLLDPQRTYATMEMNVLRLVTRTLTTYRAVPGSSSSEVVGDLATDTGRPSEGNRVWDFTLKPNLKWQDGSVVTCSHVKYGIERRFAPIMDEGAAYPKEYLQDNATPYRGPWVGDNNGGKGLESIQCLDEKRVRFVLSRPVGDFGYTVAMSTFAAVPPSQETKQDYAKRPFSNGPYKLDGPLTKDRLVLVRNNFWVESTDQVRKAYPDKIVFDFRHDDGGVVTNELIEDQGNARNTIMIDGDVAPNFLQQVVNDSGLMSRAIAGSTNSIRFMSINTTVVPELNCRKALIYAFNKRKWRAVNGGSVTGDYATTIIPPDVKAHKDFDIYDSLANPEGSPEKAIALLQEQAKAGKPCRTSITVAYPDTARSTRLINTIVEAYQRVGIRAVPTPLDPATYYNTGVGDPTNRYALILAGWVPDWANGSAIIPPLFSGAVIPKPDLVTKRASGNVNFSMLNDESINQQMETALAETAPERQWALWGDLDQQIQQLAVSIPILYEKALQLAGSNVRGGYIHPAWGLPDLSSLGLAHP